MTTHARSRALIFGRDPAAIIAAIQAALALLIGFHLLKFIGLNGMDDLAVVMVTLNAAAALYLAWVTTETLLAPVVELFKALLGLAAIYGLHIDAQQTAMAVAAITAIATAWHRDRTSPLSTPTFKHIAPSDTETPAAA